jgi:tetratricopeptide (TPR) repeat protein
MPEIGPSGGLFGRGIQGPRSRAIQEYTQAIEIGPKEAPSYLARASARYRKGDVGGSLEDCTKAIEIDPRSPDGYYRRGILREEKADRVGATADVEKSLGVAPPEWPARAEAEGKLRKLKGSP